MGCRGILTLKLFMNLNEIKSKYNLSQQSTVIASKIMEKKGQFCHLTYKRPLKFRKEFADVNYGYKTVSGTFRLGINYDNIGAIQEKRASGRLPFVNAGLTGREWVVFSYFLKGRDDKLLARIYTAKGAIKKTTYVLNGRVVEKEALAQFCLASELKEEKELDSFDINLEYITDII